MAVSQKLFPSHWFVQKAFWDWSCPPGGAVLSLEKLQKGCSAAANLTYDKWTYQLPVIIVEKELVEIVEDVEW